MKRKDAERLFFIALAIVATLVTIFVSASILAPHKRSDKAKYSLECGPQYVKLPKEKCEIKEAK